MTNQIGGSFEDWRILPAPATDGHTIVSELNLVSEDTHIRIDRKGWLGTLLSYFEAWQSGITLKRIAFDIRGAKRIRGDGYGDLVLN